MLLCIGSHSKLWLNCVIIGSLKFGSAAAFLHFIHVHAIRVYCAIRAFNSLYVLFGWLCVGEQPGAHDVYTFNILYTHTHTSVGPVKCMKWVRWVSWVSVCGYMRERCRIHTNTLTFHTLLCTHSHIDGGIVGWKDKVCVKKYVNGRTVLWMQLTDTQFI